MGRDWLYWVGGAGGMGRRKRRVSATKVGEEDSTSSGCMCSVFQLFDLHPFQFPLNHHHNLQEEAITSNKGIEAPRNSLEELEEQKVASMPLAMKEDASLNFPVGIQIKTRTSKTEDFSSECSTSSPGTKTPNLVARLMGLDLLPENSSPSFSSSKTKSNNTKTRQKRSNRTFFDDDININIGPRSLPETPRTSSSRRSDVEYHRLSLQNDEFGRRRYKDQHKQEDNRSRGNYTKQIVKQVKENVSRRFGIDITNREKEEIFRRDQNLVLLKPTKKTSKNGEISPKIRCLDNKNPRILTNQNQKQGLLKDAKKVWSGDRVSTSCLNKCPNEDFDNAMRKKKEEPFVRSAGTNKGKKCRKTPLSSDLLNISGPSLLPVKKDPSRPATKLPQKQESYALSSKRNTQLSRKTSHSYDHFHLQTHKIFTLPPDNTNGCATTSSSTSTAVATAAEHRNYIQRILKRICIIDKATPLTLGKWHTPSHPLDPSIFYYLELFHPSAATGGGGLSRRSNRKLIFQLVDELLAEILKPHFEFKLWAKPVKWIDDNFCLVDELCKKIEGFPAADCQVLEDIDSLIDKDLRKSELNGFEEEGEDLVCEIEGVILEELVRETVAVVRCRTETAERQRLIDVTWFT